MEKKLNHLKSMRIGKYGFLACLIILFSKTNGQIILTAPVLQDTYVSASTGASNPTASDIRLSEASGTEERGIIQFDLSSIPYGSTIMSAHFQYDVLVVSGVATADKVFQIQFIPTSWNETTVTWASQPWGNDGTITDMPAPVSVTAALVSFNTNVTSHVSYAVERKLPYGWLLKKNNGNGLITIASNNHSNTLGRPKLVIQYYPPFDISVSTLPASASTSNDGSADITVTGGSGNFSYQWYDPIGSPLVTTQDMVNQLPGLYTLKIIDNITSKEYRYFVVIGDTQASITVAMQPDESYGWDANVRNMTGLSMGPPAPEPFRNYETDNFIRSGVVTLEPYTSFIKFNYLGLEEANNVVIESATLSLFGNTHVDQGLGTSFKIKRVTQPWFENCITLINQPATTTLQEKDFNPGPTNGNPDINSDLTDFAVFHSQNPTQNYGYFIDWYQTSSGVGTTNYVNFHSSGSTTSASRPTLMVKFRTRKDYCELKEKPDGSLYNVYSLLRFRYVEKYTDADGQLNYTIYRIQNQDPVLTSGTIPLTVQLGDNRYALNLINAGLLPGVYMLEVTNEKKEKSYLRFNLN